MPIATRKPRRTKTLESIIGSTCRPRVPGAFYKLAPASPSLAIEVSADVPYVDRAAMSARAIISTPVMDRMGDVLIPEGIRLDNYRRNPVVLWAHGFDGYTKPLGKSEDPDGNLTVQVKDGHVEATCFFAQSDPEAVQYFELIAEGVIRGTSVRETPIKSSYSRDPQFGDFLLVDEWDLEEWSWCCVGVNPEAVAKAIDIVKRGRLDNRPICPSIMKSLSALCPEPVILGKGIDMTVKTPETKPEETTVTVTKSEKKPEETPPEKKPAADETTAADSQATAEEGTDGEDDSSELYGHKYTVASHGAVSDCIKAMSTGLKPCENDKVRSGMQDHIDAMKDVATGILGTHKSAYPTSKALDGDDESAEGTDSESMKAWLAEGKGRSEMVWGIASRLKSLAAAKNILPAQRKQLLDLDAHLTRLATQSKSLKSVPKPEVKAEGKPTPAAPVDDPAVAAALQEQLDKLKKLAS